MRISRSDPIHRHGASFTRVPPEGVEAPQGLILNQGSRNDTPILGRLPLTEFGTVAAITPAAALSRRILRRGDHAVRAHLAHRVRRPASLYRGGLRAARPALRSGRAGGAALAQARPAQTSGAPRGDVRV